MHKLLVNGDSDGSYATANLQRGGRNSTSSDHAWSVSRAIAAAAVRAGWDRASYLQVLLDGPYQAGRHARLIQHRRGYDRAAAWLHRAWDGAKAYVESAEPIAARVDFHAALAAFRARIERTPWRGIAGKTDMRNLIARIAICERSGGWDHTVSERDLAERMGCSRTTAHNSNQRLMAVKLLRQLDHGSPTKGAQWMLLSPLTSTLSHHQATHQGPKAGGVMSGPSMRQHSTEADIDSRTAAQLMHQDAFSHFGLGSSSLAIMSALAENDGQTIKQLQGTASVSRPTVYRHIGRLKRLGLIIQDGELYHLSPTGLDGVGSHSEECTAPATDWDDAARLVGTRGVGASRRARHAAHRAQWQEKQAWIARCPHPDAEDGGEMAPATGDQEVEDLRNYRISLHTA